jgi:methylated-DNA-[protein]-cysteine S-methyltransferase
LVVLRQQRVGRVELLTPNGGRPLHLSRGSSQSGATNDQDIDEAVIPCPFGKLRVRATREYVVGIDFVPDQQPERFGFSHPLMEDAVAQLNAYFSGAASAFSIPVLLDPGDYSRRVWSALIEIRPGQVETYGNLARKLGSGARAVAGACRRNPLPIVIPCHRVVAADGLGGYCGKRSGPSIEIKQWLLAHERRAFA